MRYDTGRCALLAGLLAFAAGAALAGQVTATFPVAQAGSLSISKQDAAGNVYLAGTTGSAAVLTDSADALVAKVSSSGTLLFSTVFGGSKGDYVSAIAVAADGSIAVVGSTASLDFPLTPDAAQTQFVLSNSLGTTGFYVRLDPNGKVLYSSYLNTNFGPGAGFAPAAISLDPTGSVFISGIGSYNSTSGALPGAANAGWILKLDAAGKIVFATGALGGTLIAIDAQGFIYITGTASPFFALPVTSGAFQSSASRIGICVGNAITAFACTHQYVAKLSPSAGTIVYATWISGTYGAGPSALLVDGQGNAILAGGTPSTDYPVTTGAYQIENYATLSPRDNTPMFGGQFIEVPVTGYVTKLNAAGSGLIFSTYLGGSGEEAISSMVTDSSGEMYLGGVTSSPDFPGLPPTPDPCRPSFVYPTIFATRLSADGSSLAETQLAFGLTPANASPYGPAELPGLGSIALDGQGKATALMGGTLATLDLFAVPSPLVCVTDSASMAPLANIAPGQLVSLFGSDLGPPIAINAQPSNNSFPLSLESASVTFSGIPAPILYVSSGQINVQVPFEIAGLAGATMNVQSTFGTAVESIGFSVVPSRLSAFLQGAEFATCNSVESSGVLPLALNADGTVNSCSNPAAPGELIRLFLNGSGGSQGNPSTGAISTVSQPLPLPATATFAGGLTESVSLTTGVGLIDSVSIATFASPPFYSEAFLAFTLTVNGNSLPDPLVIWWKPN